MSGGIFGIGTSALLAYQRALDVTGHNIANVGTQGYSRQQLDLSARVPAGTGVAQLGSGVQQGDVRRVVDEFVEVRLNGSTSAEAYERTYSEFASQIDALLGDTQTGLAPALSRFNAAVQDVATDPTSTAARQALLSEAAALTDRFAQLAGGIEEQRRIVNGRAGSTVEEINQITAGIADLNRRIVEGGGASGQPPNDLLDQREELIRQLSERIKVTTLDQSDGSKNVYAGQGQAIVIGSLANPLVTGTDGADPDRLAIGMMSGSNFVAITESVTGGRLGALLDLHDSLFDPAANGLGLVAVGLSERFNEIHEAGMDLDGQLGEAFFGRREPEVLADQATVATGLPAVTIADAGALAASDYELRFNGTDWSLRRMSDGSQIATVPSGGTLDFDGLALDMSAVAGEAAGDRFVLRPVRAADSLEIRISDPRAVAAALPVRAEAADANSGGASVLSLGVGDAADPSLTAPVDVQFTGGNFVAGATVVPPDASGDTTIDVNGWRLVVRGTPDEGDVFSVRDNAGGVGDNRGALALASLAHDRVLSGGTASIAETYSKVVADVGVKTRRAELNAQVQSQMLEDARAQRESISGVNLDEEAANLLRFQQAYQAAAQVLATASTMFETLISAVRR